MSVIFMVDHRGSCQVHSGTPLRVYRCASYQFLIHHVAPVDGGHPLSAAQVVDIVMFLFQLHHSVTQLLHAEYKR